MTFPPDGDVHLRVTLETPALIGVAVGERNFRDTRREVPGSALRGAVGFALAELVHDASHDPAFQALVAPEQGAHFGFLYPVEAAVAAAGSADRVQGPLPITGATCKHHGRDHGIVDTLLDRLVLKHALSAEQAARPGCQPRDRCALCDGPLRSATGSRRARRAPRARAVTRVSMDRALGSARDEQLFTEMLLETGTSLEGTIRNVPAHARGRLAEALGSGLLSLGRGRAMGRGRVRVEVCSADTAWLRPVIERGHAFERALVQRLATAGFLDERARRLVPVTLLSPLDDGDGDGERLLLEALGGGRCFFKARRFAREGGWDQRGGRMEPVLATAAGGVFVIELAEGTRWRDIVANLERLEQHGVGARRHQGFGQVLCFRKSLNRAVLRIRIDTVTPLLIRAGDAGLDPTAADLTPVRTHHGQHGSTVYIPGASLKGVLRAAAEAGARGQRFGAVDGACQDPLARDATSCSGSVARRKKEGASTPEIHRLHCLACRLFGSLAMKGRASVRDLLPWSQGADAGDDAPGGANQTRANQLELRHGVAIDRILGSARRQALFEQELVPAGVSFWGEIALENYQVWQLGLLAQACDEMNYGMAQLGSSKSRGLGAARIAVESIVHEQVALAGDAPLGVGALTTAEELGSYGLLPEHPLPALAGHPRGLAKRFEVPAAQADDWLAAGRRALEGLVS